LAPVKPLFTESNVSPQEEIKKIRAKKSIIFLLILSDFSFLFKQLD
jgi:hypothetical protein